CASAPDRQAPRKTAGFAAARSLPRGAGPQERRLRRPSFPGELALSSDRAARDTPRPTDTRPSMQTVPALEPPPDVTSPAASLDARAPPARGPAARPLSADDASLHPGNAAPPRWADRVRDMRDRARSTPPRSRVADRRKSRRPPPLSPDRASLGTRDRDS